MIGTVRPLSHSGSQAPRHVRRLHPREGRCAGCTIAVKWRDLAEEALAVAETMRDPEARRHTLFIAEAYKVLAEKAKERSVRLVCGLA